jgi:hypothetical protein
MEGSKNGFEELSVDGSEDTVCTVPARSKETAKSIVNGLATATLAAIAATATAASPTHIFRRFHATPATLETTLAPLMIFSAI